LKKINLKVHIEAQKTVNSQGNIEQKRAALEASQYTTSNYTTNHSNKTSMVLEENRPKDQWNKIEDSDINPHSYSYLILDKGAQNI
jgi:hypothetical protein